MLADTRKTVRLARRLHREYPADGMVDAWRTARMIRQIARQPLQPLTDQQRFRLEAEMGLADLPVTV